MSFQTVSKVICAMSAFPSFSNEHRIEFACCLQLNHVIAAQGVSLCQVHRPICNGFGEFENCCCISYPLTNLRVALRRFDY